MDIEELIEQLSKEAYGSDTKQLLLDAETALFDLYAKYKARDEMVDTLEDEVYRLMQENEKLREKIEDARLEGYAKGLGEMSAELEKRLMGCKMSEWISVKDRLPEVGTTVIAASGKFVFESYFDLSKNWNIRGLPVKFKVNHWMPLPEPPGEG